MHSMEVRHTSDLVARDQLLAKRENEHKEMLAILVTEHARITEENRKNHEAAMAARLAENHKNE